LMNWETTVCLP